MASKRTRLQDAARDYAIAIEDWVDLSPACNLCPYPVHPIDPACWQSGDEAFDGGALEAVAADYYASERFVALPGEQAMFDRVPALFAPLTLACVTPADPAHVAAWERAGHKLRRLPTLARALAAATPSILVANPNASTATAFSLDALLEAAAALHRRGGFLIVDERYIDAEPACSLAPVAGSEAAPNIVVLRSLDAFFGLSGARVAFVIAAADKLDRLREFGVNAPLGAPSRAVARQALADMRWQESTRLKLAVGAERLAALIRPLGAVTRGGLFCAVQVTTGGVHAIFEHFARRAILVGRCDNDGLVRFAVPRDEPQWLRLGAAVAEWTPPNV